MVDYVEIYYIGFKDVIGFNEKWIYWISIIKQRSQIRVWGSVIGLLGWVQWIMGLVDWVVGCLEIEERGWAWGWDEVIRDGLFIVVLRNLQEKDGEGEFERGNNKKLFKVVSVKVFFTDGFTG